MLTLPAHIHIRIPRAIPHSSVRPTMARSALFQSSASSQSLTESLQPPVSENVPTDSGKLIGRSLWAHQQRKETSRRSLKSGASGYDSSDSNDLITRHRFLKDTRTNVQITGFLQETRHIFDHVRYTPPAELRRNYETLLSMIQSGPSQTTTRDLPQRSKMGEPTTGPSRLPGAPYKDFVDELLADIDVRGYRLSPEQEAFVDDLLHHCFNNRV